MRLREEFKVPLGGFRGGFLAEPKAAIRNPVEALQYE
jgi:hypothetical protein